MTFHNVTCPIADTNNIDKTDTFAKKYTPEPPEHYGTIC